uniref:UDP-glucuronosyltransferase n=1 Tax=Steinernema glaseri TaxID=37863 RepID=A0A1I7Y9P5_9BILA
MISNGRIADELAKAGHEVTLFEPEFLPIASTVKSAKHATRYTVGGFSDEFLKSLKGLSMDGFEKSYPWTTFKKYSKFQEVFANACEELLDMAAVIDKLNSSKFDIFFGEQLNLCGTALSHVLGIKTHLWVSSCPLMDHMDNILGVPKPLSYVPAVGDISISDKPSYVERMSNIVEWLTDVATYRYGSRLINDLFRKRYGNDFPDVDDIAGDSPVIFVSTDEFLDFPRPTLHNIVHIGGLGLNTNTTELKEPFKSEVKKGKKGAIFFSLGSNVQTTFLPKEMKENIFAAFKEFPDYHFIVKIEKEDHVAEAMGKQLSNVYLTNWAPQTDLLSAPELKAFITHGGYNSLVETAVHAKPVIAFPFFADQYRNARLAERNGWGIPMDKAALLKSPKTLVDALEKMLSDPSYMEQSLRVQKLVLTKPFKSAEKLVKYTEFVAANDGRLPELQIAGRHLSFIEYHNLDIILPVIAVLLAMAYTTLRISIVIIAFLLRPRKEKTL